MSDIIRTLARQLAEQAEAARNSSSSLRAVDAVEYKPREHWVRQDPEDDGYFSMQRSGLPRGSLYHVGPLDAIKGIAADGAIKPASALGKTPNFASDSETMGTYGRHSHNRSFLTDADGLTFWLPKIMGRVANRTGDPRARVGIMAFEDPRLTPALRHTTHDQDINLYGSPWPVVQKTSDSGQYLEQDYGDLGDLPVSSRIDAWRSAAAQHNGHLRSLGYDPRLGAILQPPVKPGAPVLHYDNLGTPHAESYAFFINGPDGTRVEVPPELARKIAAMVKGGSGEK